MPKQSKALPFKVGTQSVFGGMLYQKDIEGWQVAWESIGPHRLWCYQFRGEPKHLLCVVMFTPGSLSGDGRELSKDDTLRIIRSAMPENAAALVLNLFTFATPKPDVFFEQWADRDCCDFNIAAFRTMPIDAVVFAYGDGGQDRKRNRDYNYREPVLARITRLRDAMSGFPIVKTPQELISAIGNPKHPKHWKVLRQIENVKSEISRCLRWRGLHGKSDR